MHTAADDTRGATTCGSFPNKPQIGILYNIGSNIEKGVIHYGTSNWGCQVEYNPQLNVGWGLSDGEGCERKWNIGSPLVGHLQNWTSQHRKTSLNLKYGHANCQAQRKAGG
ncbi:hypothetical protein DFH28DRAFT_926167 [Melampsora americana]|nr:hypothetical protein DFH28DRAFT_926167 [Melampsora americana]